MAKPQAAKKTDAAVKMIAVNRKALHNFHVEQRLEAGIVLRGTEVKALRDGQLQLGDSYALFKGGELWLCNAHIPQYKAAAAFANHPPVRDRKLLVHAVELDKLRTHIERRGRALVPLSVYFKDGKVKIEMGLCVGKKLYDKREDIKKRETDREARRAVR